MTHLALDTPSGSLTATAAGAAFRISFNRSLSCTIGCPLYIYIYSYLYIYILNICQPLQSFRVALAPVRCSGIAAWNSPWEDFIKIGSTEMFCTQSNDKWQLGKQNQQTPHHAKVSLVSRTQLPKLPAFAARLHRWMKYPGERARISSHIGLPEISTTFIALKMIQNAHEIVLDIVVIILSIVLFGWGQRSCNQLEHN
jgi:hypothetical protein